MAVTQLHDGNDSGVQIGGSTSQLVGFYGETPVDQGATITALTTTPTATDIAVAVNALISRLQDIGIIA
jgi:hypothetical protein